MAKAPEGYTCKCTEYHKFPVYVYAHWRELLIHTCSNCGRKNEIVAGTVTIGKLLIPKKKKK